MQQLLLLLLMVFIILVFIEVGLIFLLKMTKKKHNEEDDDFIEDGTIIPEKTKNRIEDYGRFNGVLKRSDIFNFLGFDKIENNMIVRKNGEQYVMVMECSGVNYYLRSQAEKDSVELGFLDFLSALKFPIQLYIQTRKLDFTDILKEYNEKINLIVEDINRIQRKIQEAREEGKSRYEIEKLLYLQKNKQNLLEYAKDSIRNTELINTDKHSLQKKNYIVVSYYKSELGSKIEGLSEEEKADIIFNELNTRCYTLAAALRSSNVTATVLNSEGLLELLFNAFNREEVETVDLKQHLFENQYTLYTKTEDVIERQKKQILKDILEQGDDLAYQSFIEAKKQKEQELLELKLTKSKKIKQKAHETVDANRQTLDTMGKDMYERMNKIIDNAEIIDDDETKKYRQEKQKQKEEQEKIRKEITEI